jgi:hypothetical protein
MVLRRSSLLALAAAAAACNGSIGGPSEDDAAHAPPPACTGHLEPGPSPMRRLTRAEYNATVRDLLGDDSRPADAFVAEEEALGFDNQASALTVTRLLAEQYMSAAEHLARAAASRLDALLPCDPVALGEDACAEAFIASFGRRAYRRPLAPDELARLRALYLWGKQSHSFATGLELSIAAMLQSPSFLYRVEMGSPDPIEGDVVALTSHEIASRLSYLLWGSMPDEALFAAADAGELATSDQVAAEARRMLADPRAREAVARFHLMWLGLSRIGSIHKDAGVYPTYRDGLPALFRRETEELLGHVVFDGPGDLATMLTAPYSFMNRELAAFYGTPQLPEGDAFVKVTLDPRERAGLLTQGSILSVYAKPNQSSPVHRGKFVRERLLCQELQPPPNDVAIVAPDVDPSATTRERFAEHSENPACAGCHRLTDPIGFGFEHYDGVGVYRALDHGRPVDATGELTETQDADGPFDGAVELASALASSEEVRTCLVMQWFRYGYGRIEEADDACSRERLRDAFEASGGNVKELLVALTQTDAFRYRHAVRPDAARERGPAAPAGRAGR